MTTSLKRNGETVFVTGATGYVGSVVSERLQAAGYNVRGLTRRQEEADILKQKGIEPFVGNVRDRDQMAKAAEGTSAIVHTAAPNDPTAEGGMEKMIAGAVQALEIMADVAEVNNARALMTSGTSIYGHTGGKTANETTPPQAMPGTEPLKELEIRLAESGQAHFIRLGVVYGRDESAPMRKFIESIRNREKPALVNPANRLSLVQIEDLADLYLAILEADAPPPIINAVSEVLTWSDVAEAIANSAGVSDQPDIIPTNDAMMLGGPAIYMPIDMSVSSDFARSTLGWKPSRPTFKESMEKSSEPPAASKEAAPNP